ncbi:POTRA domain-containing protein, partial [Lonsdalea populi]|uniref:POTRA domain-containing protein n=1 Tax=Lonsdalea populi TaxID=1172565 RepID=UPI0035A23D61
MRLCRVLGVCGLLLASASAGAASNVRLQVTGLTGDLQKNVRAQLSTITADEVSADGRFRSRVNTAIRQGLRALGYYDPEIDFQLLPAVNGGRPVLMVKVSPGEPVKIAGVDVDIEGHARNDEDFLKLKKEKT